MPLGMEGHTVKLKDYLINQKVPRRGRDAWPLVFSGATLAWIPGLRPAEDFRISPQTQHVAHLRLAHLDETGEA